GYQWCRVGDDRGPLPRAARPVPRRAAHPPRRRRRAAPIRCGTRYPAPYDQPCRARHRWQLGDAVGLEQFGVNLLRLPAGEWSSQRHWHETEDEFIYVLEGEVVLATDAGEERLRVGDCAGFKAGVADAHHLQSSGVGCHKAHDRASHFCQRLRGAERSVQAGCFQSSQ
ncbi:MAG: cupin domain-containing protein, partial [Metallibacterium scheffleri]